MKSNTLLQLAKEKQPDLSLLCYLAKKNTHTPSLISEVFLPLFKKLSHYNYEIQLQLSEVYGLHGSKEQDAYWLKNTKLIPVVAHHWLINQLMVSPQAVITDYTTYQIKNALRDINCNTREQLEGLLDTLMLQNNAYDNQILKLLENGIQSCKLTYKVSEKTLNYLLTSAEYEIVFSTCELIKKYPFILSAAPEVNLRRVMKKGGFYECIALQTLGVWGNNRIFKEVIQSESWQLESKRAVLPFSPLTELLMNTLAEYLTLHPTYSLDWLDCLLRGSSEGIHASKKRIALIIEHYFEYEFVTAQQLINLVSEESKEKLFNLSLENNAFDFKKKVKLYEELNTLDARKKVVTLLKETKDGNELATLLNTIAELKITEAETFIFPHIKNYPIICLETLKYIGSTKTINYIKEFLEFDAPIKQNIPSFEKEALTLLAHLVPDQQVIINYLQKHKLPHVNLPNLHLTLSAENESYLLKLLNEEEINPIQYGIEKLAELGSITTLEPIIKKIGLMNVANTSSRHITTNLAWEAAKKIANRAYNKHQLRSKKSNQKIVVNTALTEVILKQFENSLPDADTTLYLTFISEVIPRGFPLKKLAVLANSTNPHVIKFYISYLGKIATHGAIKQLKDELKITQNIYTLRQSLLALTALKNTSLESLVIPLLAHPNMNIKKTVAAYLTENGSIKAVTAMVHLFQRNNNTGLRTELEKGLKNILGNAYYFFLFNECLPCDVPWQSQLLENIIINDETIKGEHYIDFPELNTIAPLEKTIHNPKVDLELITKWKAIRSRTKEDLSLIEKSEDLIPKIEAIKKQADFVFITDLIAPVLRKFEKTPLAKNFNTVLTNEEARIAVSENSFDAYSWKALLTDSENEQIAYKNIITYKEEKKKENLFFHFLPHYGFQKVVTKLIEENQIGFLNKLLLNDEVAHPKYFPILIKIYNVLVKENKNSTLENCITNHSFTSKDHQKILFFLKASVEDKINKLVASNSKQQALLKKEIVTLYKNSSWKQRNAITQSIKKPENHEALFELSFTHYLQGKKVSYESLNIAQVQQLEKHPNAINLTKKAPHHLPYHSNEFILTYLKELTSNQETDTSLLASFRQLSTERKWEILKPELEQGSWYWFSFFNEFAPINTALKKWFKKASTEGKLELIKNLISTNKPLYFPQFEKELLLFIKEAKAPIAWQLLFKLQFKNNEKELTKTFTREYVNYNSSMKIELLSHLLDTLPRILIGSSIFNTLIPTDKKEEILLILLQLKTLNYKAIHTDLVTNLIKQLAKQDLTLAKQNLAEVLEASTVIGLEKQIKILGGCYFIAELNNTITTEIAHIFSTELLALSFLEKEHKNLFYKQIKTLIKTNNTEIDKKRLLKNLTDESPEEVTPLLMDILSSRKKTELDVLSLRLLKKITPKVVYLETCYSLLSSEKENLFQSIIRTLSFAHYLPVIPTLIKLLTHKNFSKDAHKALLVFGEKSIPFLTREVSQVRPDKRKFLNELLTEIENKTTVYDK